MRGFRMLVACACIGGFAASLSADQRSPPARVLLLYSVPPDGHSIGIFFEELTNTVRAGAGVPVEFYDELPDFEESNQAQLAAHMARKYRDLELSAIVAEGATALDFVAKYLSGLLPGIPVVYGLAVEPTARPDQLPRNFSGRRALVSFGSTLNLARRLQPQAAQVVVVGGSSSRDSLAVAAARRASGPGERLVVWQGLPLDTLHDLLATLSPSSIVLLADFRKEPRSGSTITQEFATHIVSESAAPVYTVFRSWLDAGVVGGAMIDPHAEGRRAGEMVLDAIRGRPLDAVHEIAPVHYVVDWNQLQRWGFNQGELPTGTDVLNQPPTIWQRYQLVIVLIMALIFGQSVLITLLLIERRERMRAQAVISEKAATEQMIAQIKTDALEYAHDATPAALEHALGRIARYAGASGAVLTQYHAAAFGAPPRTVWHGQHAGRPNGERTSANASQAKEARVEIPLVADRAVIGAIELEREDGRRWPARTGERLEAAAEVIADTVARSRAEWAARRGEALNRAVLASLSTPIAILNKGGTIVRVNDAWRDGARRADVRDEFHSFVGHNYIDECRRAEERGCSQARDVRLGLENVLKRRSQNFRYEYFAAQPERCWSEVSIDALEDASGGAVVTHIDITDRRLAELHEQESRQQVAHLGRVAVVGELAAAIAHELRQPLAAIRANAEAGVRMIARDPTNMDEIRDILRDIVASDQQAAEVIDNIRMLLRKEPAPTAQVDFNEICRHAVQLLQADAVLKHVRLALSLEAGLPSLVGDSVQLQQLVLNLTHNALDAAASVATDRSVIVTTALREKSIELSVQDTGPGVPFDVQRLFEPFFTTKEHGLGMGLAIVRSIVERHAGYLRAENLAAGGAVFTVQLPVI